jgi:hypothetical protein
MNILVSYLELLSQIKMFDQYNIYYIIPNISVPYLTNKLAIKSNQYVYINSLQQDHLVVFDGGHMNV